MFTIFRIAKLKTIGAVAASSQHTLRTRDTPNADPLGPAPVRLTGGLQSPLDDVRGALPAKYRKNAVVALECLLTASPEFFGDWKNAAAEESEKINAFFECGLARLKEIFGAENVVSAYVHLDEKTPHLVAYVVPLKNGKLNARHFVGGTDGKEKLSVMQDLMHHAVEHLGLNRGKRNSKAKHQDVQTFYGSMKRLEEEAQQHRQHIARELEEAQAIKEKAIRERDLLACLFIDAKEREKAAIRQIQGRLSDGTQRKNRGRRGLRKG